MVLTATSLIVHSDNTHNVLTNVADKLAIASVVICGVFTLYEKMNLTQIVESTIIVLTFVATIWLYIYGYFTRKYCFSEDCSEAENFHMMLHIVGSGANPERRGRVGGPKGDINRASSRGFILVG